MLQLTKGEKLLVSAGNLMSEGKTEFSAEDLVISAFKAFPEDFSMKGYPDHPDSNSVLTQIMGKKAVLIVRGWLEKVGIKKYKLTSKGISDLNELRVGEGIRVARLPRDLDEEMGHLLTSAAFDLARERKEDAITFHQFCRFVGLKAGDSWQSVEGKLNRVRDLVEEIEKISCSGQMYRFNVKGKNMVFTPEELQIVKPLFDCLFKRFTPQMEEWRSHATGR